MGVIIYNKIMPDNFSQLNIVVTAVIVMVVLGNAMLMILSPCTVAKGKWGAAARVALFALNLFALLVGALFLMCKLSINEQFAGFSVSEDFAFIVDGHKAYVPILSKVFADVDEYVFFGALGFAALCFSLAGALSQIILWVAGRSQKKKAAAVAVTEAQDKVDTKSGDADEDVAARTRFLRDKRIVKSDAERAYLAYLEDKKENNIT